MNGNPLVFGWWTKFLVMNIGVWPLRFGVIQTEYTHRVKNSFVFQGSVSTINHSVNYPECIDLSLICSDFSKRSGRELVLRPYPSILRSVHKLTHVQLSRKLCWYTLYRKAFPFNFILKLLTCRTVDKRTAFSTSMYLPYRELDLSHHVTRPRCTQK